MGCSCRVLLSPLPHIASISVEGWELASNFLRKDWKWKVLFPITTHLNDFLKFVTKGGILESLFYYGSVQLLLKSLGQFTRYLSEDTVP